MSHRSPLDAYSVPDSMNPTVELVTTFGLTAAAAKYQNRPITRPGQESSHKPGFIQTRQETLKKSETWQGDDDPSSFAGVTAKPANPFPKLASPAREKLVTDRPLSEAEKRLVRGSPAPAKPADAKDAPGTKPPTQPATVQTTAAEAKTTPVSAQQPTAGGGARPKQPTQPVGPVPLIAYGAPHIDVARIAAQSKVGYDDRIDSMHGHCAVHLQEIAGEARSRVKTGPEPSKKDVALFRQSMEWFAATALHYRDRRTALISLEATYEELGSDVMTALAARCESMVHIFSQEKAKTEVLRTERDDLRRELAKANSNMKNSRRILKILRRNLHYVKSVKRPWLMTEVLRTERDDLRRELAKANSNMKKLKKNLEDSQKKSSLCEIREKAMANDLLRKNDRLKRWRSCYHQLNVEKMDLYRERSKLRRKGQLDMSSDADIRVSTLRPPTPDPEEESEEVEDFVKAMDPLTSEELEDLDCSHFVGGSSTVSQGPAPTSAVTPTPASQVSMTPTLVSAAMEHIKMLENRMNMMASWAGMEDIMSPTRPVMSSTASSTVTSQQAADSLSLVPQRTLPPPPPPDFPESRPIFSLNVSSAEHEELLTACDTSQSKLDSSLAQARELIKDLQTPSRSLSPIYDKGKGTEDEAMDTAEYTTETTDGDSDYRPSTGRESEGTSTEASVTNPQDIPEKHSQKSGDGEGDLFD